MERSNTDATEGLGKEDIDVLVIGAGVSGLATALALIDDGREVTVIDSGLIGSGASHGNCGTLTPSHATPLAGPNTILRAMRWMFTPDAPLYIKPTLNPDVLRWMLGFALRCNSRDYEASTRSKYTLLADSRQRIQQWVERYGLQCEFAETGEDYVFRTHRDMDREAHDAPLLRELGVTVDVVDGATYEASDPAFKPGLAGALCFRGDAALRPDRYVAELARVVRERGGRIIENCALHALESSEKGVVADTAQGRVRANLAVLATGAWAPQLAAEVGLSWMRRAIQPGKGYSITYSSPVLTPKRPVILYEPSVCVTAWPSGYRLGSTMEFTGYDSSLNERRLGALERGASQFLHHPVGPEVREKWSGWRPMSRDDIPLIGRAPGHKHLWMAVGHGMMGVSMSASTGQLLADMIAGRTPCVDPAPFDPARFA